GRRRGRGHPQPHPVALHEGVRHPIPGRVRWQGRRLTPVGRPMPVPFLEVVDVVKHYGARAALDHVSFRVEEGELLGLLGPNGAGKTTLMSILSCLLEPTAGEVRLQGKRLIPSDRETRKLIGIVPQELSVYGDLTGRENLAFFGELYGVHGGELHK